MAVACFATAACVGVSVTEPPATGVAGRATFAPRAAERLVIIAAVERELDLLRQRAQVERTVTIAGREHLVGRLGGEPVVLLLGGVSLVNAAMAAQAAIDHFAARGIVLSGIAGGVNPELRVGDVVVPARWGQYQEMVFARRTPEGWDPGGRAGGFPNFGMMFPRGQVVSPEPAGGGAQGRRFWFPVDERMLEVAGQMARSVQLARCTPAGECLDRPPRVQVGGSGVSGSAFVDNAEFREYLWRTFQADAVDMETAAVAQAAFANGVPFIAFRSLSDLAGGGADSNEIDVFGRLAADNAAAVVLAFLQRWR